MQWQTDKGELALFAIGTYDFRCMVKARLSKSISLLSVGFALLCGCSKQSLSAEEGLKILKAIRENLDSAGYKAPTEFQYITRTVEVYEEDEHIDRHSISYSARRHFFCNDNQYCYTEGTFLFTVDCTKKTYKKDGFTTYLEAESAWENETSAYRLDYSAEIIRDYESNLTLAPYQAKDASLFITSDNPLSISIDGRLSKNEERGSRKIVIKDGYLAADIRRYSSSHWAEVGLVYGDYQIVKPVLDEYQLVE